MSVFRTFRKVFRDLVKLENIKSVPLDYGASVGTKLTHPLNQIGLHSLPGPVTPFFKAIANYNYAKSFASALRRDAVARLVGFKPQPMKTASLLAFLGVSYQSGMKNEKPDLAAVCEMFQSSFQEYLKAPTQKDVGSELADKLDDYDIKERLGSPSSCAAVYSAVHDDKEYAIKMMYNYGIQSNNLLIKKGFWKEYALLKNGKSNDTSVPLEYQGENVLPPHPNIIKMHHIFVDQMPCLEDSLHSYPVALPRRLNPSGLGRNKTLFLVMPKYDCSLRQYNAEMLSTESHTDTSLLLLAQILEAVAHLNRHSVAHRDLKSDNILIKIKHDGAPSVVLTDFGCCLCDINWGLEIPYETSEVDKGGNPALMAPEIICQAPGRGATLDYSHADVWAVGTLVFELFKSGNPFSDGRLSSSTYEDDDIPNLPSCAPPFLNRLVTKMLKREPKQRISATDAATVVCLALFAPQEWLFDARPNEEDIISWLTHACLTTIREALGYDEENPPTPEFQTRLSFLSRTSVEDIQECLAIMSSRD